jgi:hypothetical protein
LDYLDEIKTEPDGSYVYLPPTEASFEDNVNKTSHDQPDHVSEIKTEAEEIDVKEEELNETSHDRADYVSEVKTEEELGNPSPINSVHAKKRKTLDMEPSMEFAVAVKAMKSPLQEDEDLEFFYSLLPSVRSLNTNQKITFRSKTVQLLQDLRNPFGIDASTASDM